MILNWKRTKESEQKLALHGGFCQSIYCVFKCVLFCARNNQQKFCAPNVVSNFFLPRTLYDQLPLILLISPPNVLSPLISFYWNIFSVFIEKFFSFAKFPRRKTFWWIFNWSSRNITIGCNLYALKSAKKLCSIAFEFSISAWNTIGLFFMQFYLALSVLTLEQFNYF